MCGEVIVVLSPDAEEPSMPADVGVRFARDATPDRGPLAGVSAGLKAVDADRALVAGGDMPDLQPAVLRVMLRAEHETGADAVVLSEGGEGRPLPCVLRVGPVSGVVDTLLEGGRSSLHDVLGMVRAVVVDEPTWTALDPERRTLFDVDEPRDVDR